MASGYLSDDVGPIDPVTRRLFPYPKALSVKGDHPDLFPEPTRDDRRGLLGNQRYVLPEEIRPACVAGPCDIRYVVVHRYREGAVTTSTPITAAAGLTELCRNALNLPTYGNRGLALLAEVAETASHCRVESGSLEEAVGAVSAFARSDL